MGYPVLAWYTLVMKKAILVHGWGGHPEIYWFPWLKKELEASGYEVAVPQMPNPDFPNQSEWVKEIASAVGAPSKDLYFITHSLGSVATLRYIETLSENESIGGVVMVCGFTEPIGYKEPDQFLETPVNYEKIKHVARKMVAINSDNDPYVSMRHAEVLRDKLGAELIVMRNAGHINKDSGFLQLPEAVEALLKISA